MAQSQEVDGRGGFSPGDEGGALLFTVTGLGRSMCSELHTHNATVLFCSSQAVSLRFTCRLPDIVLRRCWAERSGVSAVQHCT